MEYHADTLCGKCHRNWRQRLTTTTTTMTTTTTTRKTTSNIPTTSTTTSTTKKRPSREENNSVTSLSNETKRINDVPFLDNDVKSSRNDVAYLVNDVKTTSNNDNDVNSSHDDVHSNKDFRVVTKLESARLAERRLEKRVLHPSYLSLKEILRKVKSFPFIIHEIDGPYN